MRSQLSANTASNRRILSGMRPTGALHLGNYHGALKSWTELQYQYECYFLVALQAAAIEAGQATGFEMLIETPFTLHFHMAVRSYGSIDMDNAITTALDALQGVAYDNDKFCCKVVGTKALLGKHELVRTEIRIEALD